LYRMYGRIHSKFLLRINVTVDDMIKDHQILTNVAS
jgi:hypothetical protein